MILQYATNETVAFAPFKFGKEGTSDAVLRLVHSDDEEIDYSKPESVALIVDFLEEYVPALMLKDVFETIGSHLEDLDAAGDEFDRVALKAGNVDDVATSLVESDLCDVEEDAYSTIPMLQTAFACETARLRGIIAASDDAVNEELADASERTATEFADEMTRHNLIPRVVVFEVAESTPAPKTMCNE